MKKTRLLEIIREEISGALSEIPDVHKDSDLLKEIEQLSEMASMKQLKDQLEKQNMDSELKAIEAAEKATIEKLKKDPVFSGEGNNQRLKGYVKNLKKELKDTHDISLQNLLSDVAAGAEEAGDKFNDDIATNTIEKNAANTVLGKESGKRGRKADPNKPKKEKSTESEPKAAKADKADSDDEAPSGDVEMEKAARSTDALIKQYQNVMDTYKKKKSEDGDKEALEYLKTKQDIVKKYKKAKSL
tara:strand:- start:926 stop:1657 length:732 start_codon:yes stop_codon:yes gene_type:complete